MDVRPVEVGHQQSVDISSRLSTADAGARSARSFICLRGIVGVGVTRRVVGRWMCVGHKNLARAAQATTSARRRDPHRERASRGATAPVVTDSLFLGFGLSIGLVVLVRGVGKTCIRCTLVRKFVAGGITA